MSKPRLNKYGEFKKGTDERWIIGNNLVNDRQFLAKIRRDMDRIVSYVEQGIGPESMEALLSQMVNIAKSPARPGAWVDRSKALRNSISQVVLKKYKAQETQYETATGKELTYVTNPTNNILGIIYAGMFYAPYVEAIQGYSVLSYAVESFKSRASKELLKRLKIKKNPTK